MFIATAHAQTAAAAPMQSAIMGWLPILLIFGVFYFFVLRPQTQRAKEHQEMVTALKRGDKVLTTGGFYGEVTKVLDDGKITLKLADGVNVEFAKQSIASVVSKDVAEPKAEKAAKQKSKSKSKAKKKK